jgi:hypothetical protein
MTFTKGVIGQHKPVAGQPQLDADFTDYSDFSIILVGYQTASIKISSLCLRVSVANRMNGNKAGSAAIRSSCGSLKP